MEKGEPLDCPFCQFSSYSHGELVFHVENVHPEAIRSSFNPYKEVNGDLGMQQAGARDDNSDYAVTKDPDFIECQCGEYCLVAECESHLEMHYAEGFNSDGIQNSLSDSAGLETSFYHGKASSLSMEGHLLSPRSNALLDSRTLNSSEFSTSRQSRSEGRRKQSLVQDFIDVLRHSTVPLSTKPPGTEVQKGPRRLGVGFVDGSKALYPWLNDALEKRTGASCARRSDARMVAQATRTGCKSLHSEPDQPGWAGHPCRKCG